MNSSRFWGATFIVAGTTIGAGMLALPMASGSLGFPLSLLGLFIFWFFMFSVALVTVRLNMVYQQTLSIAGLCRVSIGKIGTIIASFSLLCLFYALNALYITGASQVLTKVWGLPFYVIALFYTLFFGFFVYKCIEFVDYSNRFLFMSKVIIFTIMLVGLFPHINVNYLSVMPKADLSPILASLPVFFTSFGFHGSLPTLINYLDRDEKSIQRCIFIGSLIPLIVYALWQICSLGVLPPESVKNYKDLGIFIQDLSQFTGKTSSVLPALVPVFSFLAITTSFLGVSIGLFDYIKETSTSFLKKENPSRLIVSFVTFIPSLAFALFYPDGFMKALGFAAIFLSMLAVLLPCVIAYFYAKTLRLLPFIGVMLVGILIVAVELLK